MKRVIAFHKPEQENGYLGNWYIADFKIDGKVFSSIEQYMMYEKARVFNDDIVMERVMELTDAQEIKKLGRQVRNYNDHVWNGIRQIVVFRGVYAKFEQNEELKEKLLATGDAILVEAAGDDRVWGVGLTMYDPDRMDPEKWQGTNYLGYILMEVRRLLGR